MKDTQETTADIEATGSPSNRWHKKLLKLSTVSSVISLLGLVFVGLTKNPNGGPITILSFLLLVFVFSVSVASLVIQAFSATIRKQPVRVYKLFYSAFLVGLGIVFLTGLQTLRQLQPVDIILVLLFELLLNFYFLRRF